MLQISPYLKTFNSFSLLLGNCKNDFFKVPTNCMLFLITRVMKKLRIYKPLLQPIHKPRKKNTKIVGTYTKKAFL